MIKVRNPKWEADFHSLEQGWNSHGAHPIMEPVIERAKRFLAKEPQMVPTALGGVLIEWDDADVEIEPNGEFYEGDPLSDGFELVLDD